MRQNDAGRTRIVSKKADSKPIGKIQMPMQSVIAKDFVYELTQTRPKLK